MMKDFSSLLFLFAILFSCSSLLDGSQICDNGEYKIEEDISGEDGSCKDQNRLIIKEYLKPAGLNFCTEHTEDGGTKCMSEELHYSATPPLSGDYRPLAPKYGEYSYLPPQRWLHVLKYGAVVLLYHPCAPMDQVIAMKDILSGCMRKHIITPYPHLSEEKPLALVTLGCMYNMSWVDKAPVEEWITAHALKASESVVTQDGEYDSGLVQPADIVSDVADSIVCPSSISTVTIEPPDLTTPTTIHNTSDDPIDISPDYTQLTTPTNCSNDCPAVTNHITVVYFIEHHILLFTLFIISLVLFILLLSIWICYLRRNSSMRERRRRVTPGKYKPMNSFFPKPGGVMAIAIPEMGLPKAMPSEREKLIVESDEDEL
ncbi:PREDICTED: uncharacterized protein LOC109580924 [Amphimedon queenslandica]|uniref:Uncharacterized protein n=1 Tax=Amphimedon queenslandica TaxID=400682 RepID=A0A1X7V8B7_AMPQE|nr:PREDICTED: uncharacterized protein LOC109580924 [Amphimedon queenslandica]|eukprot:XP_019850077.1 PREDICTED: uncharacterized protein LOC109580924 [Amphimedon queenslandica]